MAAPLPPEIWHMIIGSRSWNNDELRALRLTNRQLSQMVTPVLFNAILLRPNSDSKKRAGNLVQAPHLACHVRSLYVRSDKTPCASLPEDELRTIMPRYAEAIIEMREKEEGYKETDYFEDVVNFQHQLPNLTCLDFSSNPRLLTEWSNKYCHESEFLGDPGMHTQLVLCRIFKPTSTRLRGVTSFFHRDLGDFDWFVGLNRLKRLDLEFEERSDWEEDSFRIEGFKACLAAACHVEELRFAFEDRCPLIDDTYNPVTMALLQSSLPHLQRLHLKHVRTESSTLLLFLGKHRKTLEDLTLEDLELADEYPAHDGDKDQSPVANMIVALREQLHLKMFRLAGVLGNPDEDGECYAAEAPAYEGTTLHHIRQFVCHAAGYPFPGAAQLLGHPQWYEQESSEQDNSIGQARRDRSWMYEPSRSGEPLEPFDIMLAYQDETWQRARFRGDWDSELEEELYSDEGWYSESQESDDIEQHLFRLDEAGRVVWDYEDGETDEVDGEEDAGEEATQDDA